MNDKLEQAINLLIDINRGQDFGDMQSVFARVERCWGEDTSYFSLGSSYDCRFDYNSYEVGYYQCATTTALLHNLFGGIVMEGEADGRKHYWNKINGVDVDLTRRQFEAGTVITNIKEMNPNKLVVNEWMAERYENLHNRYYAELKKENIENENEAGYNRAKWGVIG